MAIRFTNCILAIDGTEHKQDLTISPETGKILSPSDPTASSNADLGSAQIVDLGGRLLAPGMIDIQLNGALGFDFSTIPEDDSMMEAYDRSYRAVCRDWVKTGVTSFLPTIVTNPSKAYKRVCVPSFYITPIKSFLFYAWLTQAHKGPAVPGSRWTDAGRITGHGISWCPLRRALHPSQEKRCTLGRVHSVPCGGNHVRQGHVRRK